MSLGAQGHGVARLHGEAVYLPGALPGEVVRVRFLGRNSEGLSGQVEQILTSSPARVAPPCPHFGVCGGCALQHLNVADYHTWKRELAVTALARRGLTDVKVAPLVAIPPGSRRRADLAFFHSAAGIRLGFFERRSHRITDLSRCPILLPSLEALIAPLRSLLAAVTRPGDGGEVGIGASAAGVDMILAAPGRLDLARREALAAFAEEQDLARLSWRHGDSAPVEPVVQRRRPTAEFAGIAVDLPPGVFLQPSTEGEAVLVARVLAAVGNVSPVADLYAGVGSLTFPLAVRAGTLAHAAEGNVDAVQALSAAARRAGLAGVTAQTRDLSLNPLSGAELGRFAAVVFDPPRSGAKSQALALAASGPEVVVGVSCHPPTFARDARILVDGGYHLEDVLPVDQFPWSPHLELVAVFRRVSV